MAVIERIEGGGEVRGVRGVRGGGREVGAWGGGNMSNDCEVLRSQRRFFFFLHCFT